MRRWTKQRREMRNQPASFASLRKERDLAGVSVRQAWLGSGWKILKALATKKTVEHS
jgi:hypothetical protein